MLMFNLVLSIHIFAGFFSIILTMLSAFAVLKRSKITRTAIKSSNLSIFTVLASGASLILLGSSLLRVCITLSVYLGVIVVANKYIKLAAREKGLLTS